MSDFNPDCFTTVYCETAAVIHKTGFDFPWDEKAFESLIRLPSTVGWINETGLLLCERVCDEMEILTICVLPDSRRSGLGMKWLSHLFAYARQNNIKRIFLEVSVQNVPAFNLYKKAGFTEIGKRPNYYRTLDGFCDALCMEKVID